MFGRKFKKKADGEAPDKRKIKSTKVEEDGILFDSKLEHYFYTLLKQENVDFVMKQQFVILEGFEYRHENIRPMTLMPDYYLPTFDCFVDTKGFQNDVTPIKYKLFKAYLRSLGRSSRIEMPNSQKKCRELLESLKRGYFLLSEPLSTIMANRRRKKLTDNGFVWNEYRWVKGSHSFDSGHVMSLEHYDFEELILNSK